MFVFESVSVDVLHTLGMNIRHLTDMSGQQIVGFKDRPICLARSTNPHKTKVAVYQTVMSNILLTVKLTSLWFSYNKDGL